MDFDTLAALMVPGDHMEGLLAALVDRPAWMTSAACRDHPGVDLFPDAPARGIAPDVGPALAVCKTCPVTARCLEHAEEHGEAGIWGGTTARQRRARSAA